jgi:hypothetical protein
MQKYLSILLFLFSCVLTSAENLHSYHLLTPEDLTLNNPYQEIDLSELEKLKQTSSEKEIGYIKRNNASFTLQSHGLFANFTMELSPSTDAITILPKGWLLLNSPDTQNLYFENGELKYKNESTTTITFNAVYPVDDTEIHWNINIPITRAPLGEGIIKFTKEYMSAQLQLLTSSGESIKYISLSETPDTFLLSNTAFLNISAHKPAKSGETQEPSKQPEPQVKRNLEPLVFAESMHWFNLGRTTCKYKMKSNLKISRVPIRKLEFLLPEHFQLKEVNTYLQHRFSVDKNKLTIHFYQNVHDNASIELRGELPINSESSVTGYLESTPVHYAQIKEERGFLCFFTDDVLRIDEVGFKDPDKLNQVDISELPPEMLQGIQVPILWAYRYFEPQLQFSSKTVRFEPYPTLKRLISSFDGTSELNSDFTALHRWTFMIENQQSGPFTLPLPEKVRLKICRLNGREVPAFEEKPGKYSIELPVSQEIKPFQNQQVSFLKNSQNLSTRIPLKVEAEFYLTEKSAKKEMKLNIPLPKETQNIHYHVKTAKGMDKVSIQSDLYSRNDSSNHFSQPIRHSSPAYNLIIAVLVILLCIVLLGKLGIFLDLLTALNLKDRLYPALKIICTLFLAITFLRFFAHTEFLPTLHTNNFTEAQALSGYYFPKQPDKSQVTLPRSPNHFFAVQGKSDGFHIYCSPDTTSKWLKTLKQNGIFILLFVALALLLYRYQWKKNACLTLLLLYSFSSGYCAEIFLLKDGEKERYFVNNHTFSQLNQKPETAPLVPLPLKSSMMTLKVMDNYFSLVSQYQVSEDSKWEQTQKEIQCPGTNWKSFSKEQNPEFLRISSTKVKLISANSKKLNIEWTHEKSSQLNRWQLPIYSSHAPVNSLTLPQDSRYSFELKPLAFKTANQSSILYYLAGDTQYTLTISKASSNNLPAPSYHQTQTVIEPDRTTVEAEHDVELEENFITLKTTLELLRKGTPESTFYVHLPEGLHIRSLKCSRDLKDWFTDQKNRLVLNLPQPFRGKLTLTLESELKLKDKSGTLGCFFMPGAEHFKNTLTLHSNENLSFQVNPSTELLTSLADEDYKSQPGRPVFRQILRSGVTPKDQNLIIRVIPRQIVQTTNAYIDSLQAVSYLSIDSTLYTRYQMMIRNNGQQFLRFIPSSGESILTAKINGERIYLGKDNESILVPMKMMFDDELNILPFLFECTTSRIVEKSSPLNYSYPKLSLPVAGATLKVSSSNKFPYEYESGAIKPKVSGKSLSFLSTQKMGNLFIHDDVPVDLPVFVNQHAQNFQTFFLQPEETYSTTLKLSSPLLPKHLYYLGLSLMSLFLIWMLFQFRILFKPTLLIWLIACLALLKSTNPYLTQGITDAVLFSPMWFIPLLIFRVILIFKGIGVKK